MEVFRITHEKWANTLVASGFPARWNSQGIEIIYTAGSRSLACLENIVHRNKSGLTEKAFRICRKIGDNWAIHTTSPVLYVPSAIIKHEYNVLLNVHHPEFKSIRIVDVEPFMFDPRIKT